MRHQSTIPPLRMSTLSASASSPLPGSQVKGTAPAILLLYVLNAVLLTVPPPLILIGLYYVAPGSRAFTGIHLMPRKLDTVVKFV